MKFDCTGVILAGGENIRLPGKKKTFQKVGDITILESIYNVFSNLFKEVIIVVNEPREFAGWDMTVVTDIIPARCALAGLHAGIFYASYPHAYLTACDTPFVKPEVIEYIVGQIEPGYDVVLPRTSEGYEPLSAVYSKDCLPLIEKTLEKNIFMIKKFFRKKKVKEIPVEQLKTIDPELRFIFNINTPQDLEHAKKLVNKRKKT